MHKSNTISPRPKRVVTPASIRAGAEALAAAMNGVSADGATALISKYEPKFAAATTTAMRRGLLVQLYTELFTAVTAQMAGAFGTWVHNVVCPKCGAPITKTGEHYVCASCKHTEPA